MNRCRKCGHAIGPLKLRCETCIKDVDKELNGEKNMPLDFYFQYYYYKCKKQLPNYKGK